MTQNSVEPRRSQLNWNNSHHKSRTAMCQLGWNHLMANKPFPDYYDNWEKASQMYYEEGRICASDYIRINGERVIWMRLRSDYEEFVGDYFRDQRKRESNLIPSSETHMEYDISEIFRLPVADSPLTWEIKIFNRNDGVV